MSRTQALDTGADPAGPPAQRADRALAPLLTLFFFSGATGLVYQTVWARQLHLVFGTSTLAVATVQIGRASCRERV